MNEQHESTNSPSTNSDVSDTNTIRISIQTNVQQRKRTRRTKQEDSLPISTKDVELLEHQHAHYTKLLQIFERSKIALDLSPMGTGKTYTATKIAEHLNVQHVIVVAPVSVLPKWQTMKREYGLKLLHSISYCSLRSIKYKQPSHGLLTRVDTQQPIRDRFTHDVIRHIDKTEFIATSELKRIVQEGVLLIVDEIQNVKNVSSQFLSVQEIIREITDGSDSSRSKVLLLSGTPIDKEMQVINLYRAMNILKGNLAVYDPHRHRTEPRGFVQLFNEHVKFLSEDTRTAMQHFYTYFPIFRDLTRTGVRQTWDLFRESEVFQDYHNKTPAFIREIHIVLTNMCTRSTTDENVQERATTLLLPHIYQMFLHIFCKVNASKMSLPPRDCELSQKNAKYPVYSMSSPEIEIDTNLEALLLNGVQLLKRSTNFNHETGTVHFENNERQNVFQGIVRSLSMIETAKLGIFKNIAKYKLLSNPECKVVIFLNYTLSIDDLKEELKEFNPLIFHGSTNMRKREDIISKFQSDSLEHRLILGNLQCLSTGIDLDDKFGNRPRVALVSPNYCTITLRQLSFRFLRADTRSNTEIQYIFGRKTLGTQNLPGYEELPILHALARKSNVIRQVENANTQDIRYPGDFTGQDYLINSNAGEISSEKS